MYAWATHRHLVGRHVIGSVTLEDGRIAKGVQHRPGYAALLLGNCPAFIEFPDLDGQLRSVALSRDPGVIEELQLVQKGEYLLVGRGKQPLDTIDMVFRAKRIPGAWTAPYIRNLKRGQPVSLQDPRSGRWHQLEPLWAPATVRAGDMVLCKVSTARCFEAVETVQKDRVRIRQHGWINASAIFGVSVEDEL